MKSRWSNAEARRYIDQYADKGVAEDLALRVYTSRLLGRRGGLPGAVPRAAGDRALSHAGLRPGAAGELLLRREATARGHGAAVARPVHLGRERAGLLRAPRAVRRHGGAQVRRG